MVNLNIKRMTVAAWAAPLLAMGTLAGLSGQALAQQPPPAAAAVRGLPDFTDLVEQVGPAVVNIRTMERVRAGSGANGQMDEEMQEFFRRFFGQRLFLWNMQLVFGRRAVSGNFRSFRLFSGFF